jgi:hypothetical protein
MSREPVSRARCWRFLQKASGACGDLGTFIPHAIGAMTIAALPPAGVLLGFRQLFAGLIGGFWSGAASLLPSLDGKRPYATADFSSASRRQPVRRQD